MGWDGIAEMLAMVEEDVCIHEIERAFGQMVLNGHLGRVSYGENL